MNIRLSCCLVIAALCGTTSLHASANTDNVDACLDHVVTPADRAILAKWVFASISAHPSVEPVARITPQDHDDINMQMGELVTRLLAKDCQGVLAIAVKYEGQQAIQSTFGYLGQLGMNELFSNSEVESSLHGLERYVDLKKLEPVLNSQRPDDKSPNR